MDIKHVLDARAVLTLGKDMVFRDYAQGAFRMRGIARGQTIQLFIIPEVATLIRRELAAAGYSSTAVGGGEQTLRDVTAWLTINSMRSERVQFNQLCLQNVANVWRKKAFNSLLTQFDEFCKSGSNASPRLQICLDAFREKIDFSVESCVPQKVPFHKVAIARKPSAAGCVAERLVTGYSGSC